MSRRLVDICDRAVTAAETHQLFAQLTNHRCHTGQRYPDNQRLTRWHSGCFITTTACSRGATERRFMYHDPRPSLAPPLRMGAALLCLFLGLIGLVLPLIPGIPLLIVGVLLLRRRRPIAPAAPVARRGLSGFEQLELQFWLLARRATMAAESLRLARHRRIRQRDR